MFDTLHSKFKAHAYSLVIAFTSHSAAVTITLTYSAVQQEVPGYQYRYEVQPQPHAMLCYRSNPIGNSLEYVNTYSIAATQVMTSLHYQSDGSDQIIGYHHRHMHGRSG